MQRVIPEGPQALRVILLGVTENLTRKFPWKWSPQNGLKLCNLKMAWNCSPQNGLEKWSLDRVHLCFPMIKLLTPLWSSASEKMGVPQVEFRISFSFLRIRSLTMMRCSCSGVVSSRLLRQVFFLSSSRLIHVPWSFGHWIRRFIADSDLSIRILRLSSACSAMAVRLLISDGKVISARSSSRMQPV